MLNLHSPNTPGGLYLYPSFEEFEESSIRKSSTVPTTETSNLRNSELSLLEELIQGNANPNYFPKDLASDTASDSSQTVAPSVDSNTYTYQTQYAPTYSGVINLDPNDFSSPQSTTTYNSANTFPVSQYTQHSVAQSQTIATKKRKYDDAEINKSSNSTLASLNNLGLPTVMKTGGGSQAPFIPFTLPNWGIFSTNSTSTPIQQTSHQASSSKISTPSSSMMPLNGLPAVNNTTDILLTSEAILRFVDYGPLQLTTGIASSSLMQTITWRGGEALTHNPLVMPVVISMADRYDRVMMQRLLSNPLDTEALNFWRNLQANVRMSLPVYKKQQGSRLRLLAYILLVDRFQARGWKWIDSTKFQVNYADFPVLSLLCTHKPPSGSGYVSANTSTIILQDNASITASVQKMLLQKFKPIETSGYLRQYEDVKGYLRQIFPYFGSDGGFGGNQGGSGNNGGDNHHGGGGGGNYKQGGNQGGRFNNGGNGNGNGGGLQFGGGFGGAYGNQYANNNINTNTDTKTHQLADDMGEEMLCMLMTALGLTSRLYLSVFPPAKNLLANQQSISQPTTRTTTSSLEAENKKSSEITDKDIENLANTLKQYLVDESCSVYLNEVVSSFQKKDALLSLSDKKEMEKILEQSLSDIGIQNVHTCKNSSSLFVFKSKNLPFERSKLASSGLTAMILPSDPNMAAIVVEEKPQQDSLNLIFKSMSPHDVELLEQKSLNSGDLIVFGTNIGLSASLLVDGKESTLSRVGAAKDIIVAKNVSDVLPEGGLSSSSVSDPLSLSHSDQLVQSLNGSMSSSNTSTPGLGVSQVAARKIHIKPAFSFMKNVDISVDTIMPLTQAIF